MNEIIVLTDTINYVREKFIVIMRANYVEYVCYQDDLFNNYFTAFLKTFSGRRLIYNIVMCSASNDFMGLNPQSNLMLELAFIVFNEHDLKSRGD